MFEDVLLLFSWTLVVPERQSWILTSRTQLETPKLKNVVLIFDCVLMNSDWISFFLFIFFSNPTQSSHHRKIRKKICKKMQKIASVTQGPCFKYLLVKLAKIRCQIHYKCTVSCYSLLACKVEIQKPSRLIMVWLYYLTLESKCNGHN